MKLHWPLFHRNRRLPPGGPDRDGGDDPGDGRCDHPRLGSRNSHGGQLGHQCQRVPDVSRRLPPVFRVHLQAGADDAVERGGFQRDALLRGAVAGQHFVQHQSQRVNIAARVRFLALESLRRHVGRRAHNRAAGGQSLVPLCFRQSEVQDLDARFGHHDIAGFQIAVNDSVGVRRGKRIGDLRAVLQHQADRERTFLQPGGESFALHQFHHEVIGTDIVERADVGMIQSGDRSRLALEAIAKLLGRDFDGDFSVEPGVHSAIHFAHPARAEWRLDAVGAELRTNRDRPHSAIGEQFRRDLQGRLLHRPS